MGLVVYDPTSGPIGEETAMAPRRDSLKNGVVGVIDNGKANSDKVLNRIVSGLGARFPLKDTVFIKKHSVSHAVRTDVARRLAETCDFVLAGIGD